MPGGNGGQKSTINKKGGGGGGREQDNREKHRSTIERIWERFGCYSLLTYKAANNFTWTLESVV